MNEYVLFELFILLRRYKEITEIMRRIERIEDILTKRIEEVVLNDSLHINEIATILRFPSKILLCI